MDMLVKSTGISMTIVDNQLFIGFATLILSSGIVHGHHQLDYKLCLVNVASSTVDFIIYIHYENTY